MRKQTIFTIISCLLILNIIGCKNKFDEKEYLTKILNNIEQVKSASYFLTRTSSLPLDTTDFRIEKWYVKEFSNPADTLIGGFSFGRFYSTDTTKMISFIDGNARILIDDDFKTISIDSFRIGMTIRAFTPFLTCVKNIIQYALTSNDSLITDFFDFGDSLLFRLTIHSDKNIVLFLNRPSYFEKPDGFGNEKYEIWINKTTGLPYKYSNSSYMEEYSDIQINKMEIKEFIPSKYFPANYVILVNGQRRQTTPEVNLVEKTVQDRTEMLPAIPLVWEHLIGKTAPDWTLSDYNNESFALKDFRSRVLMIQFSGIGCAPCLASLPFLNQLVIDYKDKSFELVRIESWSKDIDLMKRYILNNDIKYRFLISNGEIEKQYYANVVPSFFILDNHRVVQEFIRGYAPEKTDKEIKEAIDKLLK